MKILIARIDSKDNLANRLADFLSQQSHLKEVEIQVDDPTDDNVAPYTVVILIEDWVGQNVIDTTIHYLPNLLTFSVKYDEDSRDWKIVSISRKPDAPLALNGSAIMNRVQEVLHA